ncbi:hypothetical protein [Thermomonas sp.]|uniref:hypothetical protein n=1 Tax=Thermomonas sp. TaxID=1971895 RepID=UPI0035ADEF01
MKIEFELWQLITLALTLAAAFTALGKLLLWQHARHVDGALEQIRGDSQRWRDLERDFLRHLADLPVHYVRREDWVRGQTVIEAKLDAIASEVKVVQIQGASRD